MTKTVYQPTGNSSLFYVPKLYELYVDKKEPVKTPENEHKRMIRILARPSSEYITSQDSSHFESHNDMVRFEISDKQYETLLELIRKQEKLAELEKKVETLEGEVSSFIYPEDKPKAEEEYRELIKKGEHLNAYEVINRYRLGPYSKALDEELFYELYAGVRDIDASKSKDLLKRFWLSRHYNEKHLPELYYYRKLDDAGRIVPAAKQ